MKTCARFAEDIAETKRDIHRCVFGDLAQHSKAYVILTQLVRRLNRLEGRSEFNRCLRIYKGV